MIRGQVRRKAEKGSGRLVRGIAAAAVLAVWLAPAGVGLGADWPWFRGPTRDGLSSETGINKNWAEQPPPVLWTTEMHDEGFAGPAVAGGVLYIIDHQDDEDVVRAMDVRAGAPKWEFRYEAKGKSNYGYARSTPTVDGELVYTVSRDGVVHCLNAASGARVWRRDVVSEVGGKPPSWMVAASAVIDGDRLLAPGGGPDALLVVLDKKTGKTIWQGGGTADLGYATPVKATLGGRVQYLVFNAEGLCGIDAVGGKPLWQVTWKTRYDVNAADPLPLDAEHVFLSSGYGKGCGVVRVRGEQAELVWTNKEIQAHFSSAILVGGLIYGTGDPGNLVCLDPRDGRSIWKQGGFEKGGLVGVDGHMIVADGKDGEIALVEINPREYREKGKFRPLGGQSWTAPIVADGLLVVRNKEALAVARLK